MLSIRVRLLAFLIDLSLGHILFYINSDFFYQLNPSFLSQENHFIAAALVMLLIPTFIIRFYGTLLGSLSPGQWLCSLSVSVRGVRARLLGAIRVFSEILTIPLFFIFQLPLLWGQKSLGERLSGTRLYCHSVSASFQFLMVIVFMVVSLLLPMFQYFIFSDKLQVSFSRQELQPVSFQENRSANIYSSNRFNFQTRSILDEGRFILLPDFEVIKIKNRKKISPILIIYDSHNKKIGQLKLDRKFDLLSTLEKARWGNPLFRYNYPQINHLLESNRQNYERMQYLEKYDGNPLIPIKTQKEIEFFMGEVFGTNVSKMWIHLITKGPFVKGYWKVKKDFLDLVQWEVRPEVYLRSLGEQSFLHFNQVYSFLEYPLRDTYIPMGTNNGIIFHTMWEEGAEDAKEKFFKKFFYSAKWYFDFEGVFSFPTDGNRLTPFHIIDYFVEKDIGEGQRKILENYLLKFCHTVSRKSVVEKDRKLEALLLSIFDRYRFVAQTEYLGVRKEFVSQLNSIYRALKLRESDFFREELSK